MKCTFIATDLHELELIIDTGSVYKKIIKM